MQRLTWVFVAVGFAVWVLLAVMVSRWASATLQTAAAPAPSTLEEVSGIVLYREANQPTDSSARPGLQLYERDEVTTSLGSNAVLRTFDNSAFRLFPSARLQVSATRIGRFNPGATQEMFTLVAGAARLSIPDSPNKAHTLNVLTPHGAAAFVPGEYTLRVGPDGTRIAVWEGRTAAAVDGSIVEIAEGQKIILRPNRTSYDVVPALENILTNGDFSDGYGGWQVWEDGEPGRPDVPGRRAIIAGEGGQAPRQALRVSRTSLVDAHNETGLSQDVQRDVSGAREIVVGARIRVDFASLSGGGYLGSEYPLMMRVRYHDDRGVEQTWTQGFYYANPENRPVPVGLRVERGQWTDVSFDLTQPQLKNPPAYIDTVQIFGAGHTFDASISDVRLLAD
jgi:hypothetical protein